MLAWKDWVSVENIYPYLPVDGRVPHLLLGGVALLL